MTSVEPLPHGYPFRFADRTVERTGPASGRVRAVVSANARGVAHGGLNSSLLSELMAQAALLLEGGDPEIGRSGFLAGFSEVSVVRVPEAGDVLTVDIALAGRLGPFAKFTATIADGDGTRVASGSFSVRKGTVPGAG